MSAVLDLDVGPRPLRGSNRLPGYNSISHRALLFAGLAEGRSRITGLGTGGDVAATAAALRALGVAVARQDGAVIVDSPGLAAWSEPDDVVDCGNSG
ncbi:MAG: 3-phosphoshikimate 1-carboxyvinyltransferase, partial [Actinomycetota bacterium]